VVIVHVAGAVQHPGIVTLPARSRVYQAIAQAGGATAAARLDSVNLAAVLQDGQQVFVPAEGDPVAQPPPPGASGAGAGSAPAAGGAKVNLNTASAQQLAELPRVGPVLAQKIIDWRSAHGGFSSVSQLDAVDGIGAKMLETLTPLLTV
jgi:competence protein ComEA